MKNPETIEKAVALLDEYQFGAARTFLAKQGYSEDKIETLFSKWDRGDLKNPRHFNPELREIPNRKHEEYRPY